MQGLAQLGLATPAERFGTSLYAGLALVAAPEQRLGGLSSFGAEIAQLASVLPNRHEGWLYLLDEPGRATRVDEGRAITRAVIEVIAQSPSRLLLSTHLDGLEGPGVERFSMRGLRREALAASGANGAAALEALMDYRVVAAGPATRAVGEALDVAELLGLEHETHYPRPTPSRAAIARGREPRERKETLNVHLPHGAPAPRSRADRRSP